ATTSWPEWQPGRQRPARRCDWRGPGPGCRIPNWVATRHRRSRPTIRARGTRWSDRRRTPRGNGPTGTSRRSQSLMWERAGATGHPRGHGRATAAVEGGISVGKDAAITTHQPVALTGRAGGHPEDRLVEPGPARRTEEAGVPEGEHPSVPGHKPVALTGRAGGHPEDRLVEPGPARRTEEAGVPEGEHPAVGGHKPVALTGRAGGHPDDRLVEPGPARRTEEAGVPEREHPAVGGHKPVPHPIRSGRYPDHW